MAKEQSTRKTDVLVLGGGPGGYAAAFRAADLGLKVTLLEAGPKPGGVCLFRGCIPSKALLHVAARILEARDLPAMGVRFGEPEIDLEKLRKFKEATVAKLTDGLFGLTKKHGVDWIQGRGRFEDSGSVRVDSPDSGVERIEFDHAIVATGSLPVPLPGSSFGLRVINSTAALELQDIPESLLMVGGGYIGLELGLVYASLGSRITLVEMTDRLAPGVDQDLIRPLSERLEGLFEAIHLETSVEKLTEKEDSVQASLKHGDGESEGSYDRALVAIGRRPASGNLGLEKTGAEVDDKGFLKTDNQCRTADERIFAIGDIAGQPLLAHKATFEGKVAAEAIAGKASAFDARAIPAVIFTQPEVAWCGLLEEDARKAGRKVRVGRFPWSASGRAATLGVKKGLTKLVLDPESGRVLGMGIVGEGAGELISEGVLAMEMGATAEDVAQTIHPHPTLSEGTGEAAAALLGTSTHVLPRKQEK